jgi:RHS repeat-associated protein
MDGKIEMFRKYCGTVSRPACHRAFVVTGQFIILTFSTVIAGAQVQIPTPGLITTVAGNGTAGYSGDGGAATSAQLNYPQRVAVDSGGNIYISDSQNRRVRKVNATNGFISTVAFNGANSYSGDGGAASNASSEGAEGLAVDVSGNIYIADTYDQRIRKVSVATGIITTIAGNGTAGFSGDGGPATSAKLDLPSAIALDSAGNLYIADTQNDRIRKVTLSTGIITTVAGSGNGSVFFSGDGGAATSASLYYPQGVALDAAGNIYISDGNNQRIRKVTIATGIITTIAGNGTQGYAGDGGPATSASFYYPQGIAVDGAGNVYIADQSNHRLRKITASTGTITTIAGNGTAGFSGDGGPATSAELYPYDIALDAAGNIYVPDTGNTRIRVIGQINPAKSTPTLALTSSSNPMIYGANSVFTATITGGHSAGGTVTFQINGTTFGTATVSGTTAVYNGANEVWAPGTYTISAVYSGDANNNGATATLSETVNKATPVLNITSSGTPSIYGTLTFTATISGGVAGAITFLSDGTSIGTGTINGATATLNAPTLVAGSHAITATWGGNGNYNAVSSPSITQVVNKATPVITWPPPAAIASNVLLSTTQLNATANVPGSFAYAPALGSSFSSGTYTLSVVFTPSDSNDYISVTKTVPIVVNQIADHGTVALQINGATVASTNYGVGSTPASVAQGLASGVIAGSPVKVTAINNQIYIESNDKGSAANATYTLKTINYDSANFAAPSFVPTALTGTLTGGADQNTQAVTVYSYGITDGSGGSGYARNGNLTNVIDSVMGTWAYGYDSLNRLNSATQAPVSGTQQFFCWSYDSFGNRTNQATSNQAFSSPLTCQPASVASFASTWVTYTPNNNQIQTSVQLPGGIAGSSATWPGNGIYDLDGNVINDGQNQYLYDAEGRVCAVQSINMELIGYQYDADGNRVGKGTITSWGCDVTTNGYSSTNDYVLDQGGGQMTELVVGQNGKMTWQHSNVMANGILIATYDPNGLHFYLNDPLGTRRVQTNSSGIVEQTCQSLPFGDQLSCTVSNTTPTEHHFTGKERDNESQLDYFGARYYSSNNGRFMSPDWAVKVEPVPYSKLDNPQSLNLYAYVFNNPLTTVDPDGHAGGAIWQHGTSGQEDCANGVHEACQPNLNVPQAQQQSSSGPGFWGRLGQRLNNFLQNNGFVTNAELDQVHGVFASAYIVPGSVQEIRPDSYVTMGLDAAGIGATLSGHAYLAGGIAAGSSIYNPDPMNIGLNGMSLVPDVLGEAAMPLTVLNDAGGLAGGVITNNVMAPMIMSIPGNTTNDGYGHSIPTPEATCVASGMC